MALSALPSESSKVTKAMHKSSDKVLMTEGSSESSTRVLKVLSRSVKITENYTNIRERLIEMYSHKNFNLFCVLDLFSSLILIQDNAHRKFPN